MRILYLQQLLVLPGCPGNARCYEFARQWTAAGHEVHFLSSDAGIPPDHPFLQQAPKGLHFHLLPVPYAHEMPFRKRLLAFWNFYRKALKKGKKLGPFDRIVAYSAPLTVGEIGRKLARHHQVPFVFEIADVWPDVPIEMGIIPPGPWRKWVYRRTQKMYQEAAHITVFSEGMKAQVLKHQVPSEKVSVIHNGVNLDKVAFSSRQLQAATTRVLYAGTIGLANDLSQLLQLAQRCQSAGRTDIQFHILGGGNDEKRIKEMAQDLALGNLTFHARVAKEEAAEIMQTADIGYSSFAPYPVLEANSATKFFDYLAAGLPILLNYQGWQADYLDQYQCGFSAPQGALDRLYQQLLRLVDQPVLRKQMGQNGRQLAEQFFDREKLAQQMLAIVKTVV